MSFFPTADPEKLRAAMAQQYAYYQMTATGPQSGPSQQPHGYNDEQHTQGGWPVVGSSAPDTFATSQPMVWPYQNTHGLALDMMTTPTQGMFDSQYPTPTSSHIPPMWSTSPGMPIQPTSYPEYAPQRPAMEDCYPLAGQLPNATTWPTTQQETPTFVPVYNSPGRSDYSTSSHQSLVESSPYAHSDSCYQLQSPPYIKVEDVSEAHRPRLYSVPGSMPLDHPSHVNPGDVYTSPPPSAGDQAALSSSSFSSKSEDEEDVKPFTMFQRPRTRRAVSEDSSVSKGDHRTKRGYTTDANSTCHCEKCGKLFQRSYNLKAHMDTHDPHREQPHACHYPGCKRRFVRRTDLIRHERSVSDLLLP